MADFVGLVRVLKRLVMETYYATQPAWHYTGCVTSASPLEITVDDRLVLTEQFLIVGSKFTDYEREIAGPGKKPEKVCIRNALQTGDAVLLLRAEKGQRFVVLEKMANADMGGLLEGGGGTGTGDITATQALTVFTKSGHVHDIPCTPIGIRSVNVLHFEVTYDSDKLAVYDLCLSASNRIVNAGSVPDINIMITQFDPAAGHIIFTHTGAAGTASANPVNVIRFKSLGIGDTTVNVKVSGK